MNHTESTTTSPAEVLKRNLERARALEADVRVEELFDRKRAARPFDMAGNRRGRALDRLSREASIAADLAGVRGLEPARADLEAAFRRMVDRRLTRAVNDVVVVALDDVRVALGLAREERPERLTRALNGDGAFTIYHAGGSRRRRSAA